MTEQIQVLCCCDPNNELGFINELPGVDKREYVTTDEVGNIIERGFAYDSHSIDSLDPVPPMVLAKGKKKGKKRKPKKKGRKSWL